MEKDAAMSASTQRSTNLFQVYLRLRPPYSGVSAAGERFLTVETPEDEGATPKHITLNPPNDRRRAVEKFAFTQVFEEEATQLDIFHCTGVADLVKGVLAPCGGDGTDALLATLGVTGSGKTHTILGSRSQRGLTQLALDVVFRSVGQNLLECDSHPTLEQSIVASDPSEAAIFSASTFLDSVYADAAPQFRASSRAATPMIVGSPCSPSPHPHSRKHEQYGLSGPGLTWSHQSVRMVSREDSAAPPALPSSPITGGGRDCQDRSGQSHGSNHPPNTPKAQRNVGRRQAHSSSGAIQRRKSLKHFKTATASIRQKAITKTGSHPQGESVGPGQTPSRRLHRPSAFPQQPDVSALSVSCDPSSEYAVLVSMYEVYNDRIFDLLTPAVKSSTTKEYRRRPLLFKSTEASPDRKMVAGLRKVICGNLHQALMVLEAGLHERRVAGTGSNSVSSRSHGFFCVEVKKRPKARGRHGSEVPWGGSALTIVDLAGSERARDAKTAGATLAEAGKINESLMYLGQCLQMQSDAANKDKPNLVPFRQCKLTELLFSNCYPPASAYSSGRHRNPQKAAMIVTADPHGDFNATSQILRYSALAREVTVPRIPSITQTILTAAAAQAAQASSQASQLCSSPLSSPIHTRPFSPPGYPQQLLSSPTLVRNVSPISNTGSDVHRTTMEAAALEIARLSEEVEYLRRALDSERAAREEAESHLLSMEDRMIELEQAIREDCTNEFERRLEIEMARWRATMQVEMERGEEHWGRKIEVFERSMGVTLTAPSDDGWPGSDEDKENVLVENTYQENERLRGENDALRRELATLTPSKRVPLQERGSDASVVAAAAAPSTAPARSKHAVETGSPRPLRKNKGGGGGGAAAGDIEGSLRLKLENLRVSDGQASVRSSSGSVSPKKMRRFATKRWNAVGDDDDLF